MSNSRSPLRAPGSLRSLAVISTTDQLTGMVPALKPQTVEGYKTAVRRLALGGWLTPRQAAVLSIFADVL